MVPFDVSDVSVVAGPNPKSSKPIMPATLAQKLTIEALGTALLVFTVAVCVGQGAGLAAVAIGSTLMCAIYGERMLVIIQRSGSPLSLHHCG